MLCVRAIIITQLVSHDYGFLQIEAHKGDGQSVFEKNLSAQRNKLIAGPFVVQYLIMQTTDLKCCVGANLTLCVTRKSWKNIII